MFKTRLSLTPFSGGVIQNYKMAAFYFHLSSEQGNRHAKTNLGWLYERGYGVSVDYPQALYLYTEAADDWKDFETGKMMPGHSMAQNNLGCLYRDGKGTKPDPLTAVKWFRKAANQGNADSQSNLGAMYLTGSGVPQDFELSYIWLSVAAANGAKFALETRNIVVMNLTKDQLKKAETIFKRCRKKPTYCP